MRVVIRVLRSVWAFPATVLGLLIGAACTPLGARWQVRSGILECHGRPIAWLLEHATLLEGGAMAITFGEVVLGRTPAALDLCRDHELVHVAQARRWGPLFIPAYLACSAWIYVRGSGNPYLSNPFEVEAYAVSNGRRRRNG